MYISCGHPKKEQFTEPKNVLEFETDHDCYTDRINFEDSYQLVKHFPDFTLWEYRMVFLK